MKVFSIEKIEACDSQLTKPSKSLSFKKPDPPKSKSDIKVKASSANKNDIKPIKKDKMKEINKFKNKTDENPKPGKLEREKTNIPVVEESNASKEYKNKNAIVIEIKSANSAENKADGKRGGNSGANKTSRDFSPENDPGNSSRDGNQDLVSQNVRIFIFLKIF